MSLFTYHLVKLSFFQALNYLIFQKRSSSKDGMIYCETMSAMVLGSSLFSKSRIASREIVFFAQWENNEALENFLRNDSFGKILEKGWYAKLKFVRQWGKISGFQIPKSTEEQTYERSCVVSVTIAKMRYKEIPRFLRWGRPVEKLVRDHPGTTLSLASIRYPNTISTFSIWKTQKEMTDMVRGHSNVPKPKRHIDAMGERDRKDFHFEFTTLRFLPISEHGTWKGTRYILSKTENL